MNTKEVAITAIIGLTICFCFFEMTRCSMQYQEIIKQPAMGQAQITVKPDKEGQGK